MTRAEVELLRCELIALYGLGYVKAAWVAEETAAAGCCPFTVDGRQYVTTTFKRRAGYAVLAG
jgi:hypothetical protein